MIILPCLGRAQAKALIAAAIAHLGTLGDPSDVMVNKVLEAEADGTMMLYDLPEE